MEKNANQFREMYARMGISIDKLGCIMLDLNGDSIPNLLKTEDLYFTTHPDRFWIDGFVAGTTPHVTLLYGLLESGNTVYREYVDEVLNNWGLDGVEVSHVDYFDSPYPDEPYYCVIAHIKVSDELKAANQLLQLLPHINTFPDYRPHVTIAYIKKDIQLLQSTISQYNDFFSNTILQSKGLNYGK